MNSEISYIPFYAALLGGFLSIIGGALAVIIRLRIERKQEIEFIKIGLLDELQEICAIIGNLCETYRTTHSIPNSYLNELKANQDGYETHRKRLFIISDETVRKSISALYKQMSNIIEESLNTVGKLGESEKGEDHNKIVNKFKNLSTDAKSLQASLKKYRYKNFWFI